MQKIVKFIICLVTCHLAGFTGSFFTGASVPGWYNALNKPELTPPGCVFAPVWLTLYTLMGISLFLIINKGLGRKGAKTALLFFSLQLFLNALWSIVFFGMHLVFSGLMIIALLWLFIFMTIISFKRVSKPAAYLLIPYLLWVIFAMYLNYAVYKLN